MDDQQFRKLLDGFGLSWEGYRKVRKGVKKRIRRHMQQLKCPSVESYLLALDQNQDLRLKCERLLTVSISRFFRDRVLWNTLENQIIPSIIMKNRDRLKVWSAGCACGEEVYSFKIMWKGLQNIAESLPNLEVMATDMNPTYLDRARSGIYPRSSLREVPEAIRSVYFESQKSGRHYVVAALLKKDILWKVHHLFSDPPTCDFHLIFLRNNLLTYYDERLAVSAFQKIVDSLAPGGFLIIGSHENLPPGVFNLIPFGRLPYLFKREH